MSWPEFAVECTVWVLNNVAQTLVLFSHVCHSKTTARSDVSGCENVTPHTWLQLQISVAFSIVRRRHRLTSWDEINSEQTNTGF